jgi:hypothetical protein
MKNLIYVVAALFSVVFLSACSNTDQDPISPNISQIEKGNVLGLAQPFALHQTFPELITSTVNWKDEKGGILITVNELTRTRSNRYLFATLEYANNNNIVMAFLGNAKSGQYHLTGLNARDVITIKVFYYDETSNGEVSVLPYSGSDIFENLGVKGWADGGTAVKIKSFPFPSGMNHLFAQLIGSEGSQLIFLGKPRSEDFDFPKSEKLNLKDIKLFTYIK